MGNLARGAASALLLLGCADPTAIDVTVYSEVPCSTQAEVALSVADDPQLLATTAPSAVATRCDDMGDGTARRGSVVIVPRGDSQKAVSFQLTTRDDGQPLDGCATDPSHCIDARRQLRFQPNKTIDVRVDMRLSCLGVLCPSDQTCVSGTCVPSQLGPCDSCGEPDAAAPPDASMTPDASPDATLPDASLPDGSLPPDGSVLGLQFVQIAYLKCGLSPSCAVALPQPVMAGDAIIVLTALWNFPPSTAISDTLGSSYAFVVGPADDAGYRAYIAATYNVPAGLDTVTVTPSVTTDIYVWAAEYSGVTGFDVGASATGTSKATSSGALNTSKGNELLFGYAGYWSSGGAVAPSFTVRSMAGLSLIEDMIAPTPGSYVLTGTQTPPNHWTMMMGAFKGP